MGFKRSLISWFARPARLELNIAVVVPTIVPFDGTSNAARDTIRAISGSNGWRVSVFAAATKVPELVIHQVEGADQLRQHQAFQTADVILYHFGFYNDLFEVVPHGNGKAAQAVLFHNITPADFMSDEMKPWIARSFDQLQYFRRVDRLLPFTSTNADVLIAAGMDRSRIEIVNPVVEWSPRFSASQKAPAPIEILFVGRMTKSKGVLDLLDAVDLVRAGCAVPFHVSLVGSPAEPGYFDTVRDRAATMAPVVEFVGRCGQDDLARLYRAAHILAIPSYHEGFCRPVVEGLRASCIPVGYASYHLPIAANGLGRLTEPGNVPALAAALKSTIEGISTALAAPDRARLPLDRGPTRLAEFDSLAGAHVSQFTFKRFSTALTSVIQDLAQSTQRRVGPS